MEPKTAKKSLSGKESTTESSGAPTAFLPVKLDADDPVARIAPLVVSSVAYRHPPTDVPENASSVERLFAWAEAEMRAVFTTGEVPRERRRQLLPMHDELKAEAASAAIARHKGDKFSPIKAAKLAETVRVELAAIGRDMFRVGKDGGASMKDTEKPEETYGYHVTKLHNIPSISENGLDPDFGASDRGSVAASTKDQVKGSIQTSTGVVAFGVQPGIFSTYINQFEDRRQMIEGAPRGLKPVMLRFHIAASIGPEKVLAEDYMENRARQTRTKVDPQFIEVQTPQGWVGIKQYDPTAELVEMRSGDDNALQGKLWGGQIPFILTWPDVETFITEQRFKSLPSDFGDDPQPVWAYLRSLNGKKVAAAKGAPVTFRGATLQSSGNPKTWEYAFSFAGKPSEVPEWLGRAIGEYQKSYAKPAETRLKEFDDAMKTKL